LSSAERWSSSHDLAHISGLNTSIGGSLLLINIKLDTFGIKSDALKFVVILFIKLKPLLHSAVEHSNDAIVFKMGLKLSGISSLFSIKALNP